MAVLSCQGIPYAAGLLLGLRLAGLETSVVAALIERAGLPRMRFHDLPHTAATLLLAQGVHPKIVQEMLGHSTISLTLDTYSHVIPGLQAEAAEKMEALLASR